MSQTLLRFGLWIVLIVLALYVVRESINGSSGTEYVSDQILQHAGSFGILLIAAGGVALIFEKAASKTRFRHCTLCRQPVAKGEIYCRMHLREVVEREHELNRRTRVR
jgi:hypothetical protein